LKCVRCRLENAQYALSFARVGFCSGCYVRHFEGKLKSTIIKYGMSKYMKNALVAVSGGKDSVALLAGLKRTFPGLEITGFHMNLGIPDYSDRSEEVVRKVCEKLGVPLIVYRLEEEASIPDIVRGRFRSKVCSACGTVKRHTLNKFAVRNGFTAVVTGHNLDDTVEVLFELYRRGMLEAAMRIRPVIVGDNYVLATRVKPLFEMTDEEDLLYVNALRLEYVDFVCPLVKGSRMVKRKQILLDLESKIPGFRHTLLKAHLKRVIPLLDNITSRVEVKRCNACGSPTIRDICAYCRLITSIANQ